MPRLILAVGAAIACALALSAAGPAGAADRWLRAESPNFVVYSDLDEATVRKFGERLESFDGVLRLMHRLDMDEPVRRKLPVYLLRGHGDLRRIAPATPVAIKGFYAAGPEDTFAVATVGAEEDTLLHEYVHHFMLSRYPYGYPGWLVEGYPEYFMTFQRKGDGFLVGAVNQSRASWLSNARWLRFKQLLKARPADLRSDFDRSMYYAQAWALTHWFVGDPARARQLSAYLDAVGRGVPSVEAMTQATGLSPDQLESAVRKYLVRGFPVRVYPVGAVKVAPIKVAPLPAAAADVLLVGLRVRTDNGVDAPHDRTDGPVLLAAARKAAEPHQGDRLADLTLAHAELKLGDRGRAERILQARLTADPADAEVLHLLALARLKASQDAPAGAAAALRVQARAFAGRAHKSDPNYYPTLIVYAQARAAAPDYPTENDAAVLLDALDLAPHVGEIRLNAALALAARDRGGEAADVLRPLAFNPHGGESAAKARALLQTLEGPAASAAPAPPPTSAAASATAAPPSAARP